MSLNYVTHISDTAYIRQLQLSVLLHPSPACLTILLRPWGMIELQVHSIASRPTFWLGELVKDQNVGWLVRVGSQGGWWIEILRLVAHIFGICKVSQATGPRQISWRPATEAQGEWSWEIDFSQCSRKRVGFVFLPSFALVSVTC